MKPLLLIAIAILAVGCGAKDESTSKTKPVEEKVLEVKEEVNPEEPVAEAQTIEQKEDVKEELITSKPKFLYEIRRGKAHISGGGWPSDLPQRVTIRNGQRQKPYEWPRGLTIPSSIEGKPVYSISRLEELYYTSVTIPDSVQTIGTLAFVGWPELKSITIPKNVSLIFNSAFRYSDKLTTVTFLGDAPKLIGKSFEDTAITIYRTPEAKGWGDTFGGRPVKLMQELSNINDSKNVNSSIDKPEEALAETIPESDGVNTLELEERGEYSDHIKVSDDASYTGESFELYPNGEFKTKANFKDGKLDGLQVAWHENGQKWSEINFKDGKENGLKTTWYENGQKQSEINFKNGEPEGLGFAWHRNGQKAMEGMVENGKEVSQKFWNSKGESVNSFEETGL